MEIPAWHIGLMFLIYGIEYIYRAVTIQERKFIYIGKAAGRLLLAVIYFYFMFIPTPAEIRSVWIRYGLVIFLTTDLFFVAQEHLMRRYIK